MNHSVPSLLVHRATVLMAPVLSRRRLHRIPFHWIPLVGFLMLIAGACQAQETGGSANYTLGPEDVVQITVWRRPDLSGQFTVDPEGMVSLSLLGNVTAGGKTTSELEADLTRRFSVIDPSVSDVVVSISGYFSRKVTVLGEVRNPGPRSFVDIPPIWDIVLAAGGVTPLADLKRVQVVRKEPEPGTERSMIMDLSKGIDSPDSVSVIRLRPGDVVVVPSLTNPTVYGAGEERIQVIGAVRSPGFYDPASVMTVMGALGASGGILDGADMRNVRVVRKNPAGSALVYSLDLKRYMEDGYPGADMNLQEGDVVSVSSKGRGVAGGIVETMFRFVPFATALTSLIITLGR